MYHYVVKPEEIADVEFKQSPLEYFYTAKLLNGDIITCEKTIRGWFWSEENCTVKYQNKIVIPTNANFAIIKAAYEAKVRKQYNALIKNKQAHS